MPNNQDEQIIEEVANSNPNDHPIVGWPYVVIAALCRTITELLERVEALEDQ